MKGVEADAPVFIILGVLTVLVGLGVVFGITDNFAGQSNTDTESSLSSLVSDIEDKCNALDEYNTVVTTNNEFEVVAGEVILNQDTASYEGEQSDSNRDIECSRTIDYNKDGSNEEEITLESGVWDASISGNNGNVLVEVE